MGVCSRIKEFFYGKDDVAAPPVEKPKIVESFCRSDRMTEFVERLKVDMDNTGAEYVRLNITDDKTEYRGTFVAGKLIIYDCDQLKLIEDTRELYFRGIKSGAYCATLPVRDDRRYYVKNEGVPKKEWECMPRFKNDVAYYSDHYSHAILRSVSGTYGYEKEWREYRTLLKKYNPGVRFEVLRIHDKIWCVEYDRLDTWQSTNANGITLFNVDDSEETLWIPSFIINYIKDKYLQKPVPVNSKGEAVTLYDPIRVTQLNADEESGSEGYVALRKGEYDGTFTRLRYRVEVDTEELFSNKIVNLQSLFEDIARRVAWMTVPDDGRFYLDNVVCKLKDGSTHTLDNSGFRSIGAEVFWRANERLSNTILSGGEYHSSGFWMITQNEFPKEPNY